MALPNTVLYLTLLVSTVWALKSVQENESACMCAVFMSETVMNEEQPIYSNKVFEPGCNEAAGEMCLTMCVNLAKMARDKAPAMLCSILKDIADPFKPAVFWRNCGSLWKFTGLVASEFIACQDGKPL